MKPTKLLLSAFHSTLIIFAILGVARATPVIYGQDPIVNAGTPDGWSGIAVFTTPIAAPPDGPTDGTVVAWKYTAAGGRSDGGHVTPLLVENASGVYSIIGIGETRDPSGDDIFEEEFAVTDGTDTFETAGTRNTFHMAVLQQRDGGDDAAGGVIPFGGGGGAGMFYFNTVGPSHEPMVGDQLNAGHTSGPGGRDYAIQFHVEFGKTDERFQLDITHLPDGDELEIKWPSEGGLLYNLRSETDPAVSEPIDWPILGENADIPATPPENTLTIPLPDDPTRFLVVEAFPAPPETIFGDDFESGQGDWSFGSDGAEGTAWELGTPTDVGPAGAFSPDNCFGTNLSAEYGLDADVWLRSPPIDLTLAGEATLNYAQFRDIEEGFDFGSLTVLDAADNSEIVVIEDTIDGVTADWEEESTSIPAEALGKIIKIEFRLQSDDISSFAGWYIDDFEVTVP